MSSCYIENCDQTATVKCDDCGWTGTAGQTDAISDIEQRLDAGGVVPAGQCPECGALAYLQDESARDGLQQAIDAIPSGWLYRFWNLPGGGKRAEIAPDLDTLHAGGFHGEADNLAAAIRSATAFALRAEARRRGGN